MKSYLITTWTLILILFSAIPVCFCETKALTSAEKDKFEKTGFYYLSQNKYDQALDLSKYLIDAYPSEEVGYLIAIKSQENVNRFKTIPALVENAELHGVKSFELYKAEAKALYILGGFEASRIALEKLEAFLRSRPVAEK